MVHVNQLYRRINQSPRGEARVVAPPSSVVTTCMGMGMFSENSFDDTSCVRPFDDNLVMDVAMTASIMSLALFRRF